MSKHYSIIASTSPKGTAGLCPSRGSRLSNPGREEHQGLSMTLRWTVGCPGCGPRVTVETPRYLGGGHDRVHD